MTRILGAPLSDYLPALGFLVFTIAYLAMASGYEPDARAFPSGVAWVMLSLTVLDLLTRTKTKTGIMMLRLLHPAGEEEGVADAVPASLRRQLTAIAWIWGFAVLLILIGVLYAVPVYAFSAMRFRGGQPYGISIFATVLTTLLIWLLFGVALRINLFPGVLFPDY